MLKRIYRKLVRYWKRRHYYRMKIWPARVPVHNVSLLPDGFTVRQLAQTGLTVVENFCTELEASQVIDAARGRLGRSGVLIDGKFQDHPGRYSFTAQLYGPQVREQLLFPLMQRAAMLTGMAYTNLEAVYVTQYPEGGLYNEHVDFGDEFEIDRLYTVLLYLNTLPEHQGGATVFPRLRTAVQPKVGRAVTWTNKNPDGTSHMENTHAAMPVTNGGEKWVIQFWFRRYPMGAPMNYTAVPQARQGQPLAGSEILPEGVSIA